MLNRMCSEAELAVGMQSMISSSKRANIPSVRPPSGTGLLVLTYRKFRSLRSLHMRLSIVRPFGDWIDTYMLYTRTADEPRKAVFRVAKAANRTLKGRLLKRKRRPFASVLTVSELLTGAR